MKQPFEIEFDFPLAGSDLVLSFKATATLHHSDPFYVVEDFHNAAIRPGGHDPSIFPEQEIMKVDNSSSSTWIHRDSGRESLLSKAIGKGIERALKNRSDTPH
ncbi:MAG TPA: hypothetical protein VFI06_12525 [Chitinophagaceae bacterium]|nr:hypothetical protein [Chitinophagaceae bacterium]